VSNYRLRKERKSLKRLLAYERRDHERQIDRYRHALAISQSERHHPDWVKYARWDYTGTCAIAAVERGQGKFETLGYSAVFAMEFDHVFLLDGHIGTDHPWKERRFREDAMYSLMKHLRASDLLEWTENKDRAGNTVLGVTLMVARIRDPKKVVLDTQAATHHTTPQ
jgi:hypothetical protein